MLVTPCAGFGPAWRQVWKVLALSRSSFCLPPLVVRAKALGQGALFRCAS